jgi:hypothetical protein
LSVGGWRGMPLLAVIDACFYWFRLTDTELCRNELTNIYFLLSTLSHQGKREAQLYVQKYEPALSSTKREIRNSFYTKEFDSKKSFSYGMCENSLCDALSYKDYTSATFHIVEHGLTRWKHEGKCEFSNEVYQNVQKCLYDGVDIQIKERSHQCLYQSTSKIYFLTHFLLIVYQYGNLPLTHCHFLVDHPYLSLMILILKFLVRAWNMFLVSSSLPQQELIFEICWVWYLSEKYIGIPKEGPEEILKLKTKTEELWKKYMRSSHQKMRKVSAKKFSWNGYRYYHRQYHTAILALFLSLSFSKIEKKKSMRWKKRKDEAA